MESNLSPKELQDVLSQVVHTQPAVLPPPLPRQATSNRYWLETAAYTAIVIGAIAFIGNTVLEHVRAAGSAAAAAAVGKPGAGTMLMHAQTSADAAHVTFTNMQLFTMQTCFKGIVTNKASGHKVESLVVCTGDVKPRTTVTVEAPYSVGAVLRLCKDDTARFGGMSWDLCDFTISKVEE